MYVCMHVCMYVCMYVVEYVCWYACMYSNMCVCMYSNMCVCMAGCMYSNMYMYVCMEESRGGQHIYTHTGGKDKQNDHLLVYLLFLLRMYSKRIA